MLAIKHISQVLHYYMLNCLHFSPMMAQRGSDNSEGMYHALELLKMGSDHHLISLVLFHRKILNKWQFLGYGSAIVCHLELLTFKFSYCRNKRKNQGQGKCRQRYKMRANTERTEGEQLDAYGAEEGRCMDGAGSQLSCRRLGSPDTSQGCTCVPVPGEMAVPVCLYQPHFVSWVLLYTDMLQESPQE